MDTGIHQFPHKSGQNPKVDTIWITWESQRRTQELSKALGVKLYKYIYDGNYIFKVLFLSLKTIGLLIRIKPIKIIVQNPSMLLTTTVCILKKVYKCKVIVDRHSNFKFKTINSKRIKWLIFHYLSKFTTKAADLTIVTNDFLYNTVTTWGGKGFVLQDKLPDLKLGKVIKLKKEKNIIFISTFSEDEPIEEVIKAANKINSNWIVYITGNYEKYKRQDFIINNLPSNIKLTGFLPEKDYQSLLISADLLMVLTTAEHTLNCGAYEGISLLKPLIVSDTEAIRNYFYKGVVYSKPDSNSISTAIKDAFLNIEMLKKDIVDLKEEISIDWDKRFNRLRAIINEL